MIRCSPPMLPEPPKNPCLPSPCGANTLCQVMKNRAVCSCLPEFLGDPHSGCRPECTTNSDCQGDEACLNMKCVNPCSLGNLCGENALCRCSHHVVTCVCREEYFGNPTIRCTLKPIITTSSVQNVTSPCSPSPCGNNYCGTFSTQVALCGPCNSPEYQDSVLCRPECVSNSDCTLDRACIGSKCLDPCLGACGINANCDVRWHDPICSCPLGFQGNPYESCFLPDTPLNPCDTTQCGANAVCEELNGATTCKCLPNFIGNPLIGCRLECVQNYDCEPTRACMNHKCIDPCNSACGIGASCTIVNHNPVCYCDAGKTGDPFTLCDHYQIEEKRPPAFNPCNPSSCGPNSRCLISEQGYAVCSCLPGYRGAPPLCNPECVVSSECLQVQACVNNRCVNPCNGVCGHGALCSVINHNPTCSCPNGQGDPFARCEADGNFHFSFDFIYKKKHVF